MRPSTLRLLIACVAGVALASLLNTTGLVPLHAVLPSVDTARGVVSTVLIVGGFIGFFVSLALKHME